MVLILDASGQCRHHDVAQWAHIVRGYPLPQTILVREEDGGGVEDGDEGLHRYARFGRVVVYADYQCGVGLGDAEGYLDSDEGTHLSFQLPGNGVGEEPVEGQGEDDVSVRPILRTSFHYVYIFLLP